MTEFELAVNALKSTPDFSWSLAPKGQETPLYYQYRDFDSFWSIIKSDCFWATDARFSNDSEEQRFGTNIMHRVLPRDSSVPPNLNEDYIVCFCREDDKLSQWRGYAAEGGVSVGFDFNAAVPFHVIHKDQEAGPGLRSSAYEVVFAQLGQVCYLRPKGPGESDEDYRDYCTNRIGCAEEVKRKDSNAVEAALIELKKCAPFIKHEGFKEEDEYRLVFRNEDGRLSKCIRYRSADSNGIRRPYVVVCPGNPAYNRKSCSVRLCLQDLKLTEVLKKKLEAGLKAKLLNANLVDCTQPWNGKRIKTSKDPLCFGCTRRYWVNDISVEKKCIYNKSGTDEYEVGPHSMENSVIVSQGKDQEKIFNTVYKVVKAVEKSIPVWCEGHLPIRSITVGPCTYQKETVENIRHYCRYVYWLRDVSIKASTIPFRRAM